VTAILALDLSLTATGYATSDDGVSAQGVLSAPPSWREGRRLDRLVDMIDGLLSCWPDIVVIEDIPMHAKSAGLTAQLHGAVKMHGHRVGWPLPVLVPPATLKKFATGKGNADKTAMVVAARDRLGYDGLDNNVADAMWLREVGAHLLGQPTVKLPALHLSALDKLTKELAA